MARGCVSMPLQLLRESASCLCGVSGLLRQRRMKERARIRDGDVFSWGILPVRAVDHPDQLVSLPAGFRTGNRAEPYQRSCGGGLSQSLDGSGGAGEGGSDQDPKRGGAEAGGTGGTTTTSPWHYTRLRAVLPVCIFFLDRARLSAPVYRRTCGIQGKRVCACSKHTLNKRMLSAKSACE